MLSHATFACLRHNSFLCSQPGGGTLEVGVEFCGEDKPWFNQDRQLIDMSFLLARAPITRLSLVSTDLDSESMAIAFGTWPGLSTLEFSTVPTHDGKSEGDWRFPAFISPLVLPREAPEFGVGAPREESDEHHFATRLPLKSLRVLRFNGLLRESRVPSVIWGCLYFRTALGAPRLLELRVALYGPQAEDAAKQREAMDTLRTLVDGPVVIEGCDVPDSLSS